MAARTARTYLNEGLAVLTEINIPPQRLKAFHTVYTNAVRTTLPSWKPKAWAFSVRRDGGRGVVPLMGEKLGVFIHKKFVEGLDLVNKVLKYWAQNFRLGERYGGTMESTYFLLAWRETIGVGTPVT